MLCFIVISLLTQYVSYHPAITGLFLASVAIDDFFPFFNFKKILRGAAAHSATGRISA